MNNTETKDLGQPFSMKYSFVYFSYNYNYLSLYFNVVAMRYLIFDLSILCFVPNLSVRFGCFAHNC